LDAPRLSLASQNYLCGIHPRLSDYKLCPWNSLPIVSIFKKFIATDFFVPLVPSEVAPRLLDPSWENFMNLKSTLIVSAALLFVSAPAWADSVNVTASSRSSSFSRSDIKRLSGFKTQDSRLADMEPDGDADDSPSVSAPEPGSLGLLFTGLLCLGALTGAFAYRRRNESLAGA
jgi:hypothetical protein